MPDEAGKLSQPEKEAIKAWLSSKEAAARGCPACGFPEWLVADNLTFLPAAMNVIGGANIPLIILFCKRCANIRFHSAVIAGIVPGPSASKKEAGNGE